MSSADETEIVFYEAFMHGDEEVMSALWAKSDAVCVHPGSGVISGYDAVIRSWRHILENAYSTEIRYKVKKKTVSEALAVHIVEEEIMNNSTVMATVIATNVYQKFEQGWLMIEHHGSLIQQVQKGKTLQ